MLSLKGAPRTTTLKTNHLPQICTDEHGLTSTPLSGFNL